MDELYHHGIKGQKWGVRNGPPYPLDSGGICKRFDGNLLKSQHLANKDVTIPSGFKFHRVGRNELDFNKSGGLYVSSSERDMNSYIRSLGPTLLGKITGAYADYNQTLLSKAPLKMASESNTRKMISSFLQSNSQFKKSFGDSLWADLYLKKGDLSDSAIQEAVSDPGSPHAKRLAYVAMKCFGEEDHSQDVKAFYDYVRNSGYDAIPDLHDRMMGLSETASIILNRDKIELKQAEFLTKDIMKNAKTLVKTYSKLSMDDVLKNL